MPNIVVLEQSSNRNRRRQSFLAAVAALKRVYPLAGTFADLRPPQRSQLACRFRKTCSRADRAGAGAAEICRALADPAGWERTVELLSLVDERATLKLVEPGAGIGYYDAAATPEIYTFEARGPPRRKRRRPTAESGASVPIVAIGNRPWPDGPRLTPLNSGGQPSRPREVLQ
jgi:hypothetical protein